MDTTLSENPSYKLLYDGNLSFRELCDEHLTLKHKVQQFSRSKILSEDETLALHNIKKQKLEIKDKIELMLEGFSS